MTAQVAANIAWGVWYSTWIAAVVFSAKTKTQMGADMFGLHRIAVGAGAFLLFIPAIPWTSAEPASEVARLRQRLWDVDPRLDWSLFAAVILAFAFCWWARLHLGRLWSGFVTLKEGHHIVDTGPYGLVRHPIYSGLMVAALATAFMRASPAAFAGAVLLTVGFGITALIEERFLRTELGKEAYDAYSRKVGMLIPKVG
jgi:protein-S-isoprenylcysteine O-methyltransferase Ste14